MVYNVIEGLCIAVIHWTVDLLVKATLGRVTLIWLYLIAQLYQKVSDVICLCKVFKFDLPATYILPCDGSGCKSTGCQKLFRVSFSMHCSASSTNIAPWGCEFVKMLVMSTMSRDVIIIFWCVESKSPSGRSWGRLGQSAMSRNMVFL